MALGAGLSAQLGIGIESTPGTAVAPTRFLEFDSESLKFTKTTVQGLGLRTGSRFKRSARRMLTTHGASGDITMEFPTIGAGPLLSQMFGSQLTIGTLVSAGLYKQVHQPNALGQVGKSLTIEVGKPSTDGVVQKATYNGCKITEWEISCESGGLLMLKVSIDGWNETIAAGPPTTASYLTGSSVYGFQHATVMSLGGTVASSVPPTMTIGAGTTAARVKSFSLKGTNPLYTDAFFLGATGTKAEQVDNDYGSVTGTLAAEFSGIAAGAMYDLFKNDSTTSMQVTFAQTIGSLIHQVDIILPAVKFNGDSPTVDGPGVLEISNDFEALDDATNGPVGGGSPFQVTYQYASASTAI